MATELNVSAVYLSRMIRQELDMSYIQLLTQTRLEKQPNFCMQAI